MKNVRLWAVVPIAAVVRVAAYMIGAATGPSPKPPPGSGVPPDPAGGVWYSGSPANLGIPSSPVDGAAVSGQKPPLLAKEELVKVLEKTDKGFFFFKGFLKRVKRLGAGGKNNGVRRYLFNRAFSLDFNPRIRDLEAFPPALIDSPDPASLSGSGPKLPDRLFEDSEMGSCIREFVDRLAPDHRAVVILHDLEGLKNTEIAQILDCSLDTVKIRVHRARQKLKALLADHCEFDYSQEDELRCDRKQPSDHGRS